eukprot:TRINITY_DN159_c0_g1_i11.p1 TRINITY_DN159_c0_g1~~TRINITY_DN159_c0_g1_i11.p1  ORF type:complete len:366 (-),score=62.09 TRINITY_DN159_c0_g1_i11:304-1401(-)
MDSVLCVNDTDCHGNGVCGADPDDVSRLICHCDYDWYFEDRCSTNEFSKMENMYFVSPFNYIMMLLVVGFFTHELYVALKMKMMHVGPLVYTKIGCILFALSTPIVYRSCLPISHSARMYYEANIDYFVSLGYQPKALHVAMIAMYYMGFLFANSVQISMFLVWIGVAQKVKRVNKEYDRTLIRIRMICWVSFTIYGLILIGLVVWTTLSPSDVLIHLFLSAFLGIYTVTVAISGVVYSRKVSRMMKKKQVQSTASQRFLYKNFMFAGAQSSYIAVVIMGLVWNGVKLATARESLPRANFIVFFHTLQVTIIFVTYLFVYFMIEMRSPFRAFIFPRTLTFLSIEAGSQAVSNSSETTESDQPPSQ